MAMEAPLFFRRPELTPPLSLPDERDLLMPVSLTTCA